MPLTQLLLASGNPGKLAELQALLAPLNLEIKPQSAFAVPAAAETGDTFVENALLKARNAAAHTGLPAIADDSGLAVDALDGEPGVLSARYAGADADDHANNRKLIAALDGLPSEQRGARFHSCVVMLRHARDPAPLVCQGNWRGRILETPRGEGGFGYDPLFWVSSEQASAAELDAGRKNTISHRGQAMAKLIDQLKLIV